MMETDTIERAVRILQESVPAGSSVILFGSHARGDARDDSDLDFLVVEPEVGNRFGEMARLSELLGSALIPADVVVLSREAFERWQETPNSLAYHASREGKIYDSVA